MNKKIVGLALCLVILALLVPTVAEEKADETQSDQQKIVLTHQQEVWLGALEWCESRGENSAINPKDKDGTPSYYNFQFKPSTLRYFGEKYGLIDKDVSQETLMELLKRYDIQRGILERMLSDETVNWRQQFPDCVSRLGLPPKSIIKN